MKRTQLQLQLAFMLLLVGILLMVIALQERAPVATAGQLPTLPSNFYARIITDQLELPVDMEILPSGEILVAEKGTGIEDQSRSKIKLLPQGASTPRTVLTLSTNTYWDSGIIGLELDPNFEQNHYFYVLYSAGVQALNFSGESTLRLSRFTYDPALRQVPPASELILLDDLGWEIWHHGGGLAFDAQGYLYVGIGDLGEEEQAQNVLSRKGKVLRLKPTAEGFVIPADNPFPTHGVIPREVYAWGFRNPFRMQYVEALDQIVVADVGNAFWEEINIVRKGANYGWPDREGSCPMGEFQPCPAASSFYTDPLFELPHAGNRSSSITGLAYYQGVSFPEPYRQKLFLANYSNNALTYIDLQAQGDLVERPFASELSTPVDLVVHNGRLYVVSIAEGQILEIVYQEEGQMPFSIALEAEPPLGPSPLDVTFAVEGVAEREETWSYRWDFGDASSLTTTSVPSATHSYREEGAYTVSVQVTGADGLESIMVEETVVVFNGELPQLYLTNLTDVERTETFYAGDFILYEVVRESGLEGLHPDTPYTWSINLHHDGHVHYLVRGFAVGREVIQLPEVTHAGSVDIHYEFEVLMHTAEGLSIPLSETIDPELVNVEIESLPAGGQVELNGVIHHTPYRFQAIAGEIQRLEAPRLTHIATDIYSFEAWMLRPMGRSEETAVLHTEPVHMVTIPEEDTSFIAEYVYQQAAERFFLPVVQRPE